MALTSVEEMDRTCDRCPAQARLILTNGLRFCRHHAKALGLADTDRLPQTTTAASSGHAGE